MKRILLFDKKSSHSQHMTLLLKVADLHCTNAESIDEVLNLLSIDHLKQVKFDLLLLNSWPEFENHMPLFKRLISELEIPVIYVLRDGEHQPTLNQRCISICLAENVLSCINTHLNLKSSLTENADKPTCAVANQLFAPQENARHCCSCFEIAKLRKINDYTLHTTRTEIERN